MADKALQPLYQILQQQYLSDPNQQLPLWKRVELLRNVFKEIHKKIRKYSENHDFEIRIQEAVYKAKDVLESGSSDLTDHVMEEFDSIYQEILELQHSHHAATAAAMSKFLSEYGFLPCSRGDQDFMFGFDGRIDLLAYGLIYEDRDEAEAEVEVRIFVGRAGIGKTSFARQVYGHEKIADHFDIRGWTSGFPLQSSCNLLASFQQLG